MWLSPFFWHFIALKVPLYYLSPISALILSYSSVPLVSLISSDLPGFMFCCVSITHRLCQAGSSPTRGWQCLCDISKAMQGQSLYCLLFTLRPVTPNLGSSLSRDMRFDSPQTLQQSPELSLFPLKVMMWTECQSGSEHLSRLPESSEMRLLGMGSLPVKKRYFSPLLLSLFTAAELLIPSPPYMFVSLPCPW